MVGSIFLQMSLNEAGEVVAPKVLAAVPVDGFEEKTLKTVSKWRWVKDEDAEADCRLSRNKIILPVSFLIQ